MPIRIGGIGQQNDGGELKSRESRAGPMTYARRKLRKLAV
jgi:hypothetical protein